MTIIMAYEVLMLYHLHMPSYFLETLFHLFRLLFTFFFRCKINHQSYQTLNFVLEHLTHQAFFLQL